MDCVINFNQLSNDVEKAYITNLFIENGKVNLDVDFRPLVIDCLLFCHKFYRENEDESSVSLRDIHRFIKITYWFSKHKADFEFSKFKFTSEFRPDFFEETVCAFYICYLLRSQSEDSRKA